ncbi:phage portal protein [Salmonella enterica]|nr:phage portal protein [Salmonella enterica]EIW2893237.1 phage portal protein [Salmonella enterica]
MNEITDTPESQAGNGTEVFTFGDPIPMLDQRDIFDYLECPVIQDTWYDPPLSFEGLAQSLRSGIHHSSPIFVKTNLLVSTLRSNKMLSTFDAEGFILDYLVFGNGFLELRRNGLGEPWKLKRSLAKYTRVGVEPDIYWFVGGAREPHKFPKGHIFHLMEPDINQEVYGLPQYLAALHSTWLSESAVLFRRKYYINGGHMGFVLYMTTPQANKEDVDNIREAMKKAKGMGNFKNMFVWAPNGAEKGVQVIPISEIATKDDFSAIKKETRADQLIAHRVPPQMMGIVPENDGGFGDVEKAARVFARNELVPLQARIREINAWLGDEIIAFDPYVLNLDSLDPAPAIPAR